MAEEYDLIPVDFDPRIGISPDQKAEMRDTIALEQGADRGIQIGNEVRVTRGRRSGMIFSPPPKQEYDLIPIDFDPRIDAPKKEEGGDIAKGFKRAFTQIPELAYGAATLGSMSAEKMFGDGGLSTTAKGYFGNKFLEAQTRGQENAPTVEFTDAFDNLSKGEAGSMVDWLQDSAGYVIGQGLQTVVTGGVGAIVGKTALSTLTQKMLGGMVAKQAAKIAETSVVKRGITGKAAEQAIQDALPEATKLAAERTAQAIGAGIALGGQNIGMEAGDIYGGLIEESKKTGKEITGDDLIRAWGYAAAAAGTETATDLLGLGALTGRIKIGGKTVQSMTGFGGRAARAGATAGIAIPVESGQEYWQTWLEQIGAGQDTGTVKAEKERINAAAVGALGGTIIGGIAGAVQSPAQPLAAPVQPPAAPIVQPGPTIPPQPAAPAGAMPGQAVGPQNAEPQSGSPVAESQALGSRVVAPGPSDAGVAPGQEPVLPLSPIDQARADAQVLKSGGDLLGADETRMKNATLLSIYGENAAVRQVVETPERFEGIADAMLKAAPDVERVRDRNLQQWVEADKAAREEEFQDLVLSEQTGLEELRAKTGVASLRRMGETQKAYKLRLEGLDRGVQIATELGKAQAAEVIEPVEPSKAETSIAPQGKGEEIAAEVKKATGTALPEKPALAITRPVGEGVGALPAWAPKPADWRSKWRTLEVEPGKWRIAGLQNSNPFSPSFATEAEAEIWADKQYAQPAPIPATPEIAALAPDALKGRGKAIAAEVKAKKAQPEIIEEKPVRERSPKQLANDEKLSRKAKRKAAIHKMVDQNKNSLLDAIAKKGGIRLSERKDIMGEKTGNHRVPFVGSVFSENGMGVDDMATSLAQDFYMTPQEMEDGGVNALKEKIRDDMERVIAGTPQVHYSSTREALSMEEEMRQRQEREEDAALENAVEEVVEGVELNEDEIETVTDIASAIAAMKNDPVALAEMEALSERMSDEEWESYVIDYARRNYGNQRENETAVRAGEEGGGEVAAEALTRAADNPNRQGVDLAPAARSAFDLAAQTAADLKAKTDAEQAAADQKVKDEAAAEKARQGTTGKAEQVDLFNTQGGLFGHTAQPGELNAEQRRAAYNQNQLEMSYEQAETRPDTTAKQKSEGILALRALFGRDRGEGGSILASALWKDFTERQGADLVGQEATSARDLATLAQILRDSRFETLRFFFVKDGKIVDHIGVTSRLPGAVSFIGKVAGTNPRVMFDEKIAGLKAQMQRNGADGYYVLHNHPSGISRPSENDLAITRQFAQNLDGFRGHVVIDQGEYSVIDKHAVNGALSVTKHTIASEQRQPELPHNTLGTSVNSPGAVVGVAKQLQRKKGFAVLIGRTGEKGKVTSIAEVPEHLLHGDTKMDQARAIVRVRRFGKFSGSQDVFVVSDNPYMHGFLIERGVAVDVVTTDGTSLRAPGINQVVNDNYKPGTMRAEEPTAAFSQGDGDRVNPGDLSTAVLARMDIRLKALGYDSRGSDDVRTMLQTKIAPNGVITHPDWIAAYQAATEGAQKTRERSDAKAAERGASTNIDFARMRELGLTEDWREAGYITQRGSLIDLSGKKEGGERGARSYDHREAGGTTGMQEYMALGNIRIDANSGSVDISREPTTEQYRKISEFAENHNGEVTIDLEDGLGELRSDYYLKPERAFSREYPQGTKPARIMADIRKFFSGQEPVALPKFKQGSQSPGLPASEIESTLAPFRAKLKIPLNVWSTEQARAATGVDIPANARGMYYDRELNVFNDNIATPLEAESAAWHEVLHAGLNHLYGIGSKAYEQALTTLALNNRNIRMDAKMWRGRYGKDALARAIKYGMTDAQAERYVQLQSWDETLAELSGKNVKISGLKQFLASVQKFLRSIGLVRLADSMEGKTDAEALALIVQARGVVMKDGAHISTETVPAFMYAGTGALPWSKGLQRTIQIARKMDSEGKTADEIRLATGWFKNPHDKKWRREFSDKNARFLTPEDDLVAKSGGLKTTEQGWLNEAGLQESPIFGKPIVYPLGEILHHPLLYKLYPDAKNIEFIVRKGFFDFGGLQGFFDGKNRIGITPYASDPLSTLLHEVQHWIQSKEGFATGGNTETVIDKLTQEQRVRIAAKILDKTLNHLEVVKKTLDGLKVLKKSGSLQKWLDAEKESHELFAVVKDTPTGSPEKTKWLKAYNKADELGRVWRAELFGKPATTGWFDFSEDERSTIVRVQFDTEKLGIDGAIEKAQKNTVEALKEVATLRSGDEKALVEVVKKSGELFNLYQAIAGEIESRDVQARADMTLGERRTTRPLSSETIAPEDVIVSYDTGEAGSFSRSQDQTQTAEFKRLMQGSHATKTGEPWSKPGDELVFYHGTNSSFDVFAPRSPVSVYRLDGKEIAEANSWDMGDDRTGMPDGYHYGALSDAITLGPQKALEYRFEEAQRGGHIGKPDTDRTLRDLRRLQKGEVTRTTETRPSGAGTWFTPDPSYSFISRDRVPEDTGGNVMPVYLSIKNPVYLNASEIESAGYAFNVERYKAQGYDGAVFASDPKNMRRSGWSGATQVVAFHPTQIKSAIGNVGSFDPNNPDIRFSKGADYLQSPAFKKWFGDSKVVDAEGKPLVVYHGTSAEFTEFSKKAFVSDDDGFFFTVKPKHANAYAGMRQGSKVVPVYLSIQTPLELTSLEWYDNKKNGHLLGNQKQWIKDGYDGLFIKGLEQQGGKSDTWVAFRPEQIKSAIGNTGAFDPNNPDIRFSMASVMRSSPVAGMLDGIMSSPASFGMFRGINTQYHKAVTLARKGAPQFKAVFDKLQDYLTDINAIARESEQKAPAIFRELTGIHPKAIRQYFKGAASEKDIHAIGPWLNAGTLYGGPSPMDGIVWTDAELRGTRGTRLLPRNAVPLTNIQIPLYHQARDAIAQSLEDAAKSIIYRHVKKYGVAFDKTDSLGTVVGEVRDQLGAVKLRMESEQEAATEKADETFSVSTEAQEAAEARPKDRGARVEAENAKAAYEKAQKALDAITADIEAVDALLGTKDKPGTIAKIQTQANDLIKHGYMPLKRFGNKVVTAKDENGKTRFFAAFDGTPLVPGSANLEMNQAAAAIRELHPDWTVTTGIRSERAWQMYNGLSIDALENFLDFIDPETKAELERDQVIQEYLRNAVNNRSVMKELIHRKGTPGFSKDVPRILAAFVTSHARNASGMYHLAETKSLVEEIPQDQGDVKDEAADLVKYVTEPGEEAVKLRGFLFFHFLGGSIAAAAVNLSQTPMMTAPYLAQYGSVKSVTAKLLAASKQAVMDPQSIKGEVGDALQKAENEGITAPQQIHHLIATASNNPFSSNRGFRSFMTIWGGVFGAAEVFNRRVAFLAAYDIAKENGKDAKGAYDFARTTVIETQLLYNKGNRPNLSRGAAGALVFTFKTFSIGYLELLKRLPPKQQLMMLGVLVLMAGGEGLPFSEDIMDLVDTLGQWLGFSTNTGKWTGKIVRDTLGREFERPILKGLGGMLPFDLHSRLGFQNLLPGTAFFKPSEIDKTRDVAEAVGPLGGVLKSFSDSLQLLARGKWDRAAVNAAPKTVRDIVNGIHMGMTGESQDTKGRLALKDVTTGEAASKFFGFNPQRASIEGEARREIQLDKNLRTVRMDDIASDWADGVLRKDQDTVVKAMQRLREWNKENPEMRIDGTQIMRSVRERVRAARMTSQDRFMKALPKPMRSEARESFVQ